MYEWHIGDPVDWGDGFMDAQNPGYGNSEGQDDSFSDKLEIDKFSIRAWKLCRECKYEAALQYGWPECRKLEHKGNYPGFHGKI